MRVIQASTTGDADAVADVITLAFSTDPITRWSVPFEVIGRIQAGDSPVVTPMLRKPR